MTRYVEDVYDEDDLPPYIGERIVSSLHRRFAEHFGGPLDPERPAPPQHKETSNEQ